MLCNPPTQQRQREVYNMSGLLHSIDFYYTKSIVLGIFIYVKSQINTSLLILCLSKFIMFFLFFFFEKACEFLYLRMYMSVLY